MEPQGQNVFGAADTFDYAAARRFLSERRRRESARRAALAERAAGDAECIVAMIRDRYRPKRILQWGSVLEPRHFSEASDIDLAVDGVGAVEFLRLCADAESMFPIDHRGESEGGV